MSDKSEISIRWSSPRKEDEIYRALTDLKNDFLGMVFSIYGSEEIDTRISTDKETKIEFKNSILKDRKGYDSNLSVEGTIAALKNKRYHFYIPPDLVKYIKREIRNKNDLKEYEKSFPNTKYIFEVGKSLFEELLDLGYCPQAAYSLCGAFFVECAWNPNVYNKEEASSVSGTSSFAQGLANCGEGLFGLTGWAQKYSIILKLNLDKQAEVYGINKDGYLDKSMDAKVQKIPFKKYEISSAAHEYEEAPSNLKPKLFMCKEKVWIKIFDEFVNTLPKVADDEKSYKEYFTYFVKPSMSSDSDDLDHQLLYATYLFKAGPGTRKTFKDTERVIMNYMWTHNRIYGANNSKYIAKNGFVLQLLIAYLLAEYCCGTDVEELSLKEFFRFGDLSMMNSEFLINTYVGINTAIPLNIPPPNADGITVINHTEHMQKRKQKISYIILHYTAGIKSTKGSAESTVRTLDQRGFSSDYAIDDVKIIQFADDPGKWASTAVQRWSSEGTAAGQFATNQNSVSIEMSSSLEKGGKWEPNDPHFYFSDAVLANTAFLCKKLIKTYNIPKSHIIRHYDIMGKCCPGIIGWNTGRGSNNDKKYRDFVDSLYLTEEEPA